MSHEVSVEKQACGESRRWESKTPKSREKEAETLARSNSSLKVQTGEPNKKEIWRHFWKWGQTINKSEPESSTQPAYQNLGQPREQMSPRSQRPQLLTVSRRITFPWYSKSTQNGSQPLNGSWLMFRCQNQYLCQWERNQLLNQKTKKTQSMIWLQVAGVNTAPRSSCRESSRSRGATCEVNPKSRELKKGKRTRVASQWKNIQCTYAGDWDLQVLAVIKQYLSRSCRDGPWCIRYGSPYCPTYSVGQYGGSRSGSGASGLANGLCNRTIEKQMAAVLEKIEGDMPSLLEQISDHPENPSESKERQLFPITSPRHRSYHHRPHHPFPPHLAQHASLPHLTIPPPSYPPPSPPSHILGHSHPTARRG